MEKENINLEQSQIYRNNKMRKIYELETRRNFCIEFLLYLVSDLNINRAGISWEKLILIDERVHNEE